MNWRQSMKPLPAGGGQLHSMVWRPTTDRCDLDASRHGDQAAMASQHFPKVTGGYPDTHQASPENAHRRKTPKYEMLLIKRIYTSFDYYYIIINIYK